MERDNHARKEPSLADLEAFEKLLRESLQTNQPQQQAPLQLVPQPDDRPAPGEGADMHPPETHAAENYPAETHPAEHQPVEVRPEPVAAAPASASMPGPVSFDERAMSELARLIEAPISYSTPVARKVPAPPESLAHTHGTADAEIGSNWPAPQPVSTQPAAPAYVARAYTAPVDASLDPLAAFEEELRRFDALRLAEQQPAQAAAPGPADMGMSPDLHDLPPELRPAYSTDAEESRDYAGREHAPDVVETDPWAQANSAPYDERYESERPESPAETSLHAAEDRLAAEAAAAAAAAGVSRSVGRSKGIFLAMGGLAVAGVAIIGGSFIFGSGKSSASRSGDVPVIAAKTEPTKEKPADPGGMEIPNQNKQVLAVRNPADVKPAQVVNTTEQPLDLNQVTKRDSVRVVSPNPYQPAPGAAPPVLAPGTTSPADPAVAVEPRRVTSIRIPTPGSGGAAAPANPVAGIPASGPAVPTLSVPSSAAPVMVPVDAPKPPTPPVRVQADASAPVKVESRPVTAQLPVVAQPRADAPVATTTPPTAPPPRVTAARPSNAPLSLAPSPRAGGSGWAIQLASRPTEADARSASAQLKARYASTLGSRSPSVVSGEANGKTVYRIRVTGYNQASATDACTKIKAAGGGCFVTRQ